ncbi:unnamed protein product [Linum tenue]|uniref:Uncharacterized protein n=1 Tax=Linum tenue TaxID=586396 RepID=A0AAV0R355_9ROSI|nr:unnamed protein product [Linum tenue]
MKIGAVIGKPVRVDRATEMGARGNYARVCVEVDLTKPLLGRYKVEGIEYLMQDEGLDNICMDCGQYGSSTSNCSCQKLDEKDGSKTVEMVPETQEEDQPQAPSYGPWIMVKRKERRHVRREKPNDDKGVNTKEPLHAREGPCRTLKIVDTRNLIMVRDKPTSQMTSRRRTSRTILSMELRGVRRRTRMVK